MTTRAIYRFIDSNGDQFSVYKNSDAGPRKSIDYIKAAMEYAFLLENFAACDFAAAFIAANKKKGGGDMWIYLDDVNWENVHFHYHIYYREGFLRVKFSMPVFLNDGPTASNIFRGTFEKFEKFISKNINHYN